MDGSLSFHSLCQLFIIERFWHAVPLLLCTTGTTREAPPLCGCHARVNHRLRSVPNTTFISIKINDIPLQEFQKSIILATIRIQYTREESIFLMGTSSAEEKGREFNTRLVAHQTNSPLSMSLQWPSVVGSCETVPVRLRCYHGDGSHAPRRPCAC